MSRWTRGRVGSGNVLNGDRSAFAGSSAILALTIPVAAILAACFYVCYLILRSSAHQADAAQFEAEQRIAKAAILFTTAPVIKNNGDYAYRDELYLRAKAPLDLKWADAHLGSYQENLTGITGSAVLTGRGELQYLYLSPRSGLHDLTPGELRFLTWLTRRAIAEGSGHRAPLSGFVNMRGHPIFLSIAPVNASGLEGGPKGAKPYASLIYFLNFDSEVLSGITRDFNLAEPRVVPAAST